MILTIGISLMRVGVNWAAGSPNPAAPTDGDPFNLGMATFVLVNILRSTRFLKGFLGNIAVRGIVIGCVWPGISAR